MMTGLRAAGTALLGAFALAAVAGAARADVTVLGWPGGPEEVALRKAAEAYNAKVADPDKVKLIFFNREGFWDKLQADMAAGSSGKLSKHSSNAGARLCEIAQLRRTDEMLPGE